MRLKGNIPRADTIAIRHEMVAQLRLRGLTLREIQRVLSERGIVNNKTGKPISLTTIKFDVDMLRERWRSEALKDTSEHMARQLAEIEQVRRKAWADGDMPIVLRALELEMKLLGTAAPERIDMSAAIVGAVKLYAVENSPDIWDAAGETVVVGTALASGLADDDGAQ